MCTPSRQGFDVSYTLSYILSAVEGEGEGAQPNVRQENAEKPRWSQPTSRFPANTSAFLRLHSGQALRLRSGQAFAPLRETAYAR